MMVQVDYAHIAVTAVLNFASRAGIASTKVIRFLALIAETAHFFITHCRLGASREESFELRGRRLRLTGCGAGVIGQI